MLDLAHGFWFKNNGTQYKLYGYGTQESEEPANGYLAFRVDGGTRYIPLIANPTVMTPSRFKVCKSGVTLSACSALSILRANGLQFYEPYLSSIYFRSDSLTLTKSILQDITVTIWVTNSLGDTLHNSTQVISIPAGETTASGFQTYVNEAFPYSGNFHVKVETAGGYSQTTDVHISSQIYNGELTAVLGN